MRVAAFRTLLNDPNLADAIVVLRDESPIVDAIDNADPVASVRLLSRNFGHNQAIEILLSLAEPLPPPPQEEVATFGALNIGSSEPMRSSDGVMR